MMEVRRGEDEEVVDGDGYRTSPLSISCLLDPSLKH